MKLAPAWLESPEVKTLARAFSDAGFELRFVGGVVRDSIMGCEAGELDAATNATPPQMTALLETAGIRAIPTGIDHGTITALINGKSYEVTTLRKDVTTDGRHAEVAFGTSWEEDAKRRDFTLNALYLGTDGTLYDYVGGFDDCKAHRVRFIGDAAMRIREDYLRILRYFRFVATVGNNVFDEAALAACAANKEGIANLSGERIATEMLKLLAAGSTYPAIEQMHTAGLLSLFLPQGGDYAAIKKLDEQEAPALVKLAALIGNVGAVDAVSRRLKLSTKQTKSITAWLAYCSDMYPAVAGLELMKLRRKLGKEDYTGAVLLAYAFSGNDRRDFELHHEIQCWTPPAFPVTAKDLMQKGYKEGKALGDKLKELEKAWEDSGYVLSREALLTPPH